MQICCWLFTTWGVGGGVTIYLRVWGTARLKEKCTVKNNCYVFLAEDYISENKVYSIEYSAIARLFKFNITHSSSTRSWFEVRVALCYGLEKQHCDFCWDNFRFTYLLLLLGSLQCKRYPCRYESSLLVRVQSSAWVIIYHSFFR